MYSDIIYSLFSIHYYFLPEVNMKDKLEQLKARLGEELSAAADDLSTALEYLALNGNVAGICAFLSVRLFTHKS